MHIRVEKNKKTNVFFAWYSEISVGKRSPSIRF